ncbi:hypothetical protein QBC46DRAFT_33204 [Diplogelasinospora grovesii]|uniref:Secreted peptide n=1 Tax=Diplogelasinospora grovesii TaxID=303347 RepID=A0AAN6S890_9PEZI|nr:hypothetical protein QBC46DRAFT_33204 [Diplogelasinospora grovesii]
MCISFLFLFFLCLPMRKSLLLSCCPIIPLTPSPCPAPLTNVLSLCYPLLSLVGCCFLSLPFGACRGVYGILTVTVTVTEPFPVSGCG